MGLNVVLDVNGAYYAMLGVAAVVLGGVFMFVRSRAGLMLRGIREDALRARTRWGWRWSGAGWACSRWRRGWRRSAAGCR